MSIFRSLSLAVGLAALAVVPASASAVVHLPTTQRTLTALTASPSCAAGATDTTTWTAPMAGFLTARLRAAGGEWDLYSADAKSRKGLGASRAFGASEITQTWVDAGQTLLLTACRTAGDVKTATLSLDFADAAKPAKVTSTIVRTGKLDTKLLDKISALGLDITENQHADLTDILAPDADKLRAFKSLGIPFKTQIADLGAVDAAARAAEAQRAASGVRGSVPSGRTTYRFLGDIQQEMQDVVKANPTMVRPIQIGTTYQGRPIQGVELSTDVARTDDGKPTFFLMGVHHAREWPAAEMAMEFMHHVVNGKDPLTAGLLDKLRIVIVPVVNVDGYVSSRGENAAQGTIGAIPDPEDTAETNGTAEPVVAGGALAYRRKNCDGGLPKDVVATDQARSLPCYYQYGVDPNRNYGFDWGGPGASNDPLTQTYRGTGQWSEPETQAVHEYSQSHPVTALITMHTIAALVLRSPGLRTHGLAPDEAMLKKLGDQMAAYTGYTSQYGWQLYDTTGTTEDWNYGAAGTLGYTIEIGPAGGDFHGNYLEAVEQQWNPPLGRTKGQGMRLALIAAAKAAADPATHAVLTGTGAPGAQLTLQKSFKTNSQPICTFAQGYVTATGGPADCLAPGAVFGTTSADDGLKYQLTVPASGTFTWHVTQSTRPFEGYTYDAATKAPKPNDKPREAWTLTCLGGAGSAGGPAGISSRQVVVERGQQLDLGDVCS